MAEPPAVDASPLIVLSRAGYLDLLLLAGSSVCVPGAVLSEISQYGANDPTVRAVGETAWLRVVRTLTIPPYVGALGLGAGESAVLAWALAHPGTTAITDDLDARRAAEALGIAVQGSLGLVLSAKRRGLIREARPIVELVRDAGLYLSDRLVDDALRRVGE